MATILPIPSARAAHRRGGVLKKLMLVIAIVIGAGMLLVAIETYGAISSKPAITENYAQQLHDRTLERQRARAGDGLSQWPKFQEILARAQEGATDLQQRNASFTTDRENPWSHIDFSVIRGIGEDPYRQITEDTPRYY
ncbi:MAG: hypothetical protein ACIAQU_02770, partial [Phycisphaerales bacterium JB064]